MSIKQRWLKAMRERKNELEILREENNKLKEQIRQLLNKLEEKK